jgi:hypothetical protein
MFQHPSETARHYAPVIFIKKVQNMLTVWNQETNLLEKQQVIDVTSDGHNLGLPASLVYSQLYVLQLV